MDRVNWLNLRPYRLWWAGLIGTIIFASGLVGYMVGINQASSLNDLSQYNYQGTTLLLPTPGEQAQPTPTPASALSPSVPSLPVTPGGQIRIEFEYVPDWPVYHSPTGYSFQSPTEFGTHTGLEEKLENGICSVYFGNDAGGIISAKVVPYGGGSRRQTFLASLGDSYLRSRYTVFTEAIIQNRNSLITQPDEPRDFGEPAYIIIPDRNHALIVGWDNRAINSDSFQNLLKSIRVSRSPLDVNRCGKI